MKTRRSMVHRAFLLLCGLCLCIQASGRDAGPEATVRLPQRLMFGEEILREMHEQTGLRYAYPSGVLTRQFDTSAWRGEAKVKDLLQRKRTGTNGRR